MHATSSRAVDESSSTVSTIRSVVPRGLVAPYHGGGGGGNALDDDVTTVGDYSVEAFAGMDPYIRTSITDRVHDGTYDTDTAHKATIASRVKGGSVHSPSISCCRARVACGDGSEKVQHSRELAMI